MAKLCKMMWATLFLMCGSLTWAGTNSAQETLPLTPEKPKIAESLVLEAQYAIQRGVDYLLTAQKKNGSWQDAPAITALCMLALHQSKATENVARIQSAVDSAHDYCLGFQVADGSFSKGGRYINYTTSVVLSSLALMNRPADIPAMKKARRYLWDSQIDEDHPRYPTSDTSPYYGGIGYGSKAPDRPDLSNTQFALEALAVSMHLEGIDNPTGEKWKAEERLAWGKAIKFLQACQQLPDTATASWEVLASDTVHDGGFIYKPGESKAGTSVDGKTLRSYGSMTYAGIKSMIYAHLDKNDFRVKAARDWASKHYTLDENPGMGMEGHLYYLHTFAKANAVFGEDVITDAKGKKHFWREEIVRKILNIEQNGQWLNDAGRWMESIPELGTAYILLSLEIALAERQ